MRIFGLNGGENGFQITDDDKAWVEENFKWLIQVFGYPNKLHEQILIDPKFFPKTFSAEPVLIENVVDDLCVLFNLPREAINLQCLTDLRDSNNMPYEIDGKAFESEADLSGGIYTLYVASSLQKHPRRLIFSLMYEFIRIRLTESEIEYDAGGDDTHLFIFLAGIYYGCGVVFAQNLVESGRQSDGFWEIRWNYASEMPMQVMAYGMALYADLTADEDPEWKREFPADFLKMFDQAASLIKTKGNELFSENEIKANALFSEADLAYEQNRIDDAIAALQKILFLTNDDHMKADVYNNIGYYYLRQGSYEKGIANFTKALTWGPAYGYANDNLGYALIMTGELEEGKEYLDKAMQTKNNDLAYTYRNLGLYFQKKNEWNAGEKYFQMAFQQNTPVDLLEFHYAEFLLAQNKRQEALHYFRVAAGKNEPEAVAALKTHFPTAS
jgi:tetratricopeptide (TPR) repeat protein